MRKEEPGSGTLALDTLKATEPVRSPCQDHSHVGVRELGCSQTLLLRLFPPLAKGKGSASMPVHGKRYPREIYLSISKPHRGHFWNTSLVFNSQVSGGAIHESAQPCIFFFFTLTWKSFKAPGKNRCIIKMNKSWWCSAFQKKRKKTVNDIAIAYISLTFPGPGQKASFSINCG